MSQNAIFNSSSVREKYPLDSKYFFEATTQQFKKYTAIEANRKIKPFFKNFENQESKLQSLRSNDPSSDPNISNRNSIFLQKYLPSHHFNPRLKSKRKSFKYLAYPSKTKINDTITIDDDSDEQDNPKEKMNTIDRKFIKENRSFSLKAYLDEKPQQKLILPKITKTQNIIQIVENQFKQSKEKKKKNPRLRNIHQIAIERQSQNQASELRNYRQLKSPSQKQIFKSIPSKQSLKPLLDLDQTQAYRKKRKIELMGMKLKPVQREDSKIAKTMQNRTQRIGSLNLLPSQLIYKNPKESIEKSVYQQLIKRVFSST